MTLFDMQQKLAGLPVMNIVADVVDHVMDHGVAIVNSKTSSGKSLLIPTALSQIVRTPVITLEPRRFIAANVAETVAALAGWTLGDEIGYAVGVKGREENFYHHGKHQLSFMTVGYALSTKIITSSPVIIIDEAHENGLDMTICKALLLQRLKRDDHSVRVIIMSATIDADAEMDYWKDFNPKVFTAEGKTHPVEVIHDQNLSIPGAVAKLIRRNRTGIGIFMPGINEIRQAIRELNERLPSDVVDQLEIAEIYGDSTAHDRRYAMEPPRPDKIKLLVGTNVIESGINLPWLNAGITTGTGKELHVNKYSEAVTLELTELPSWRIIQQIGRTNRFGPGIFYLLGGNSLENRPQQTEPEILRLPLTHLAMHCASMRLRAQDLKFMPQPDIGAIARAETQLQQYGFIDLVYNITAAGEFAESLPLGLQASAILYEARRNNILAPLLPLAAIVDIGSARHNRNAIQVINTWSDIVNETCHFMTALYDNKVRNIRIDRSYCDAHNINYKRFKDVLDVLLVLEDRFGVEPSERRYNLWCDLDNQPHLLSSPSHHLAHLTKACLFAGYAQHAYCAKSESGFRYHKFGVGRMTGGAHYQFGNNTIANTIYVNIQAGDLVTATLRKIDVKRDGTTLTIAENVTHYTADDLLFIHQFQPHRLRQEYDVRNVLCWKVFFTFITPVKTVAETIADKTLPKTRQ